MTLLTNWAGNYRYKAASLHRPKSVGELRHVMQSSRQVKVVGTRHSFNAIGDCDDVLISMEHFDRIVDLDPGQRTVTIEGGVTYGKLGEFLHREGFALPNLASLPHISVAGACATATHGSGDRQGNLATSVVSMDMMTADGDIVTFCRERSPEEFAGAAVHLGALGIVTKLTLDIIPSFQVEQYVYEHLPREELLSHFDDIFSHAYSVSVFTNWEKESFDQVWVKKRVGMEEKASDHFFGATAAKSNRHPVKHLSSVHCTEQMGVPGPWHERLPHFKMDFTPSSGDELQSEYFVSRRHGVAALQAIETLRAHIAPLILVSEIRTIAKDDFWLSPCYGRDSVGFHFTWKRDVEGVKKVLPMIEEQLAPFQARPHWSKLFCMDRSRLHSLYDQLPAFQRLARRLDPQGKFQNDFLSEYVL